MQPKVPLCVFPRTGALLSVIHQSCALLKTLFYSVFSAKHSFADMKECNLKKQKLPKIGGCLPKCKKVFFVVFFLFFCGFLCLCYCVFVCKKAQKAIFLQFRDSLSTLFPQKTCFRMFIFFLFCLLSLFSFCLPFKTSIFSLLFVHQPLFGKDSLWGGFFCLSFLSFPFLMVASFFETNFVAFPFWNPSCFCFWHVFFCCFGFCFHGVCFCLSALMLALFLLCGYYVFILSWFCFFCFVSCFAFRLWKKHCFLFLRF